MGPSRKGAYNEPYQKGMYRFVDQGFYKLEAKMLDFQDEKTIDILNSLDDAKENPETPQQTKVGDLTMGRWTHTEHAKFLYCKWISKLLINVNLALNKFGKDWRRIQAFMKTRSTAQIRSHA